jgi:hypothetical protein
VVKVSVGAGGKEATGGIAIKKEPAQEESRAGLSSIVC